MSAPRPVWDNLGKDGEKCADDQAGGAKPRSEHVSRDGGT